MKNIFNVFTFYIITSKKISPKNWSSQRQVYFKKQFKTIFRTWKQSQFLNHNFEETFHQQAGKGL